MTGSQETNLDEISNDVQNSTSETSETNNASPIIKTIEEFNQSVEVDIDDQVDVLSAQIIAIFRLK